VCALPPPALLRYRPCESREVKRNFNNDALDSCSRAKMMKLEPGIANFYVGIAADIVLLYFFNNIKYVNISFLTTEDYISCLWAINLPLTAGIIGNFVLLLYRPRWFSHLVQAVLNALAIMAVYIIYKIFPFSFNTNVLDTAIKATLIVIMAGIGLGLIAETIKLGKALIYLGSPPTPPVPPVSSPPAEPPVTDKN
jgi:hypothetical protein